ncbi:MAG TPA: PVC-type heme-binding CxxCH protein [Verrucomicrobiales bacterium]|nr:PVC-type heme-binding CxxCH protein [Verrucomicrobiales bacterium]
MQLIRLILAVLALQGSVPLFGADAPPPPDASKVRSLFDGKSLEGWEGNTKLWRVEDGCVTGGSLTENVKENDFLATQKDYGNYILRLKIKLTGNGGFINSGIQMRSTRVPKSSEMCGYQCDYGDPTWWGCVYDESRRNRVMAQSDMKVLGPAIKRDDWNEYVIRADGPRITTWINGVMGVDYMEQDQKIPQTGKIGIQIHGGGKALVQVKEITIEELPPTPKREGAPEPKKPAKPSPVPAEEEKALFTLPPGFEIELVASEDETKGYGKFIAVYFDQRGRMWTMTALEYPVDANESPAAADALYASKAKDKVLVYDIEDRGTNGAPPRFAKEPKVFTDGLAIPLGILPYKDGCYVQHGHDLALLRDTDGDGKADKRELILTGFGVQDSHLFPHQFTRAPGGWIWLAQGAFNYGKVRGPEGKAVQFDQTRMARFRPDGSEFEITSNGPCNIWGLAMNGEGETFIQEANDFGYPVMPFHEYANYPGCSNGQWKSYAPEFPGTAEFRVGGTGLSGLALTDASGAYPPEWSDVMLVANPIIRKVQAIKMHRSGSGWRLEWLPDFVCSGDEWFRPVAMTLGPDGCVYIVDWYNKIISHNEVPRNHPERDKKRGRIWRVKHRDQKCFPVPDFTAMPEKDIIAKLGGASVAQSHTAWQTLVDKEKLEEATVAELKKMVAAAVKDGAAAAGIQAHWVLQEIQNAGDLPAETINAKNRNLRREAVATSLIAAVAQKNDPDPVVRMARIQTMGLAIAENQKEPVPDVMIAMLEAAPAPLDAPMMASTSTGKPIKTGVAYEREFERYLVRMFLERAPQAVSQFLASPNAGKIPAEKLMLACLALPPKESAPRVAQLIAKLDRAPADEELLRLAEAPDSPEVKTALAALIAKPASLQSLLRQKTRFDARVLAPLVKDEAAKLLNSQPALGLDIVSSFKLTELEPQVAGVVEKAPLAALRTLRLLGSRRADTFLPLAKSADPATREEALACLAAVPEKLIPLWPELTPPQRGRALEALTTSKPGAQAVVTAVNSKSIPQEELDGPILEKLGVILGESDGALKSLMEKMGSAFRPVLVLNGKDDSMVKKEVDLNGPFTVECWVRLAPGIGNEDSILGAPDQADFNFFDAKFRVWVPGVHDAIIATKPVAPDMWTHVAVTRDDKGMLKIYLNGEQDKAQSKPVTRPLKSLRIGGSIVNKGTSGALSEFRVWNVCRTPEEIRGAFDRTFPARPAGLVVQLTGADWGELLGGARIAKTTDFPAVLTPEEAKAVDAKYTKFHALAEKPGDPAQGQIAAIICIGCHTINGKGALIGPNLSGAGAMGVDGLLRNLLSPNAAMEPGYRVYRVEMTDGTLKEGFLVSEDNKAVIFRQVGMEDQRIPRDQIRRGQYLKRSLMPEGLLEAFTEQQVSDLFSYLKTLK